MPSNILTTGLSLEADIAAPWKIDIQQKLGGAVIVDPGLSAFSSEQIKFYKKS